MQPLPKRAGIATIWSSFPQPGSTKDKEIVQERLTEILSTNDYLKANFGRPSVAEDLKRDISNILEELPEFVQEAASIDHERKHRVHDDHPLLSGDLITLETHDPENYPLPDTRILLQWILNRVLASRGGVEPKDLEDDESDGDSDEGLDYFPRPVLQSPSVLD
ncbi:uncharacterized protein CDV56_100601 [Aspergillus thermomutatus]|uniref:Uncharacterized protein n=1 Tax=Aspergillus thermomutatus TaxID=41047 RepID=A0A397GNJ3_ASPTH|nr:uncharacterized protein CDV56_100601 [Aspergillus thermomutatus]RHZ52611.1 hypothetical protein CDV56_100601 [Aspergillus thermomutatus]